MKRMDVTFKSEENFKKLKEYVNIILKLLTDSGIEFINFNFDFLNVKNKSSLTDFFKWMDKTAYEFLKKGNILFKMKAELNVSQILSLSLFRIKNKVSFIGLYESADFNSNIKACKKLEKYNIPYMLILKNNDFETIKQCHDKYTNISINSPYFKDYGSKAELWFKEWLYDKNGTDINIFSDVILNNLLDNTQNNCIHNSCLGKTLFINENGDIFFCRRHLEESRLINIYNIKTLNDIFNNKKFIFLLQNNMKKRNECKKNCSLFTHCGGGCPLENISQNCCEIQFKNFYFLVDECLKEIISKGDFTKLNICVKAYIFMAMAYGKIDSI